MNPLVMRLMLISLPYLLLLYLHGLPEVFSKKEQVWTDERRTILAKETKEVRLSLAFGSGKGGYTEHRCMIKAWKHGFNGYMKYAYPEVREDICRTNQVRNSYRTSDRMNSNQ